MGRNLTFLYRAPACADRSIPPTMGCPFRRTPISPQAEGRSVILSILVLEFSAQTPNHQVFSEVQEHHTSNDARSWERESGGDHFSRG